MNLQLVYRYILSLSKNENMFYEKRKRKRKQNKRTRNKRKENFQRRESKPGPLVCKVNALSITLRQLTLSFFVKVIILNTFTHEIDPFTDTAAILN